MLVEYLGTLTELSDKTYSVNNVKSLATLSYTRNTLRGSYVGGLSGSIGNFTPTTTFGSISVLFVLILLLDNGGSGALYVGGVSAYSMGTLLRR